MAAVPEPLRPGGADASLGHRGCLVAVYGTLRVGGRLHHHLGIDRGRCAVVGRARIAGALYEVDDEHRDRQVGVTYPCFVANGLGWVVVDIVQLFDDSLLAELDRLEGFDPSGTTDNEYVRRAIALHDVELHDVELSEGASAPEGEGWVYEYVRRSVDPRRLIDSGDWIAHMAEHKRRADQPPGSSYL